MSMNKYSIYFSIPEFVLFHLGSFFEGFSFDFICIYTTKIYDQLTHTHTHDIFHFIKRMKINFHQILAAFDVFMTFQMK